MISTRAPLIDRFGRKHTYLRVSLTDRCNFRCIYCMPENGAEFREKSEILTIEEIVRIVQVLSECGMNKVRLTGGEPTVRRGHLELIQSIKKIPGVDSILMTTNGYTLDSMAGSYRDAGLNGLNISCDSFDPDNFSKITRGAELSRVLAGISAAQKVGFDSLKINVVVMKGLNHLELAEMVDYGVTNGIHIRFIEFMPFAGNEWERSLVYGYSDMLNDIRSRFMLDPIEVECSAVAKEFKVRGTDTTIGFVTSVTEDFCDSCNRIRITAEGQVKTCLFLESRSSLRDIMRSGGTDDELEQAVRSDLQTKWQGHPPMSTWKNFDHRAMVQIGG